MKKRIVALIVACILLCSFAVLANPGTSDDPLISKSYVDTVLIPYIQGLIDSAVNAIKPASEAFEIVNAKSGETIVCEANCEFIIRGGEATINASENGGICDITAGVDLANKSVAPSNHLLLVPRSDGRGITVTSDVVLMIKGAYTIQ